jgi:hypothetical protein
MSHRHPTERVPRQPSSTRLLCEQLEERVAPSVTPLKFVFLGDYGSTDSNYDKNGVSFAPSAAAVANLIKTQNPQFIVSLGDNNYALGNSHSIDTNVGKLYSNYLYPYPSPYFQQRPPYDSTDLFNGVGYPRNGPNYNRFWPVAGDHDYGDQKDTSGDVGILTGTLPASSTPPPQPMIDYFAFLNNPALANMPAGALDVHVDGAGLNGNGIYYSLKVGDNGRGGPLLQLFFLDTALLWHDINYDDTVTATDPRITGSAQYKWLEQALPASTATWKVVVGFHTLFASGGQSGHGYNPWLQWPFQQWGANAYVNGHLHVYERDMDTNPSDGYLGFPFITDGLGGASIQAMDGLAGPGPNAENPATTAAYYGLISSTDPLNLKKPFVPFSIPNVGGAGWGDDLTNVTDQYINFSFQSIYATINKGTTGKVTYPLPKGNPYKDSYTITHTTTEITTAGPLQPGGMVTLIATIVGNAPPVYLGSATANAGMVQFFAGGFIGSAVVQNGVAKLQVPESTLNQVITAFFTGDPASNTNVNFLPSNGKMNPGTVNLMLDPNLPGRTALFIYGTNGNDVIRVAPGPAVNSFSVTMNGTNLGTFGGVNARIMIYTLGGNDTVVDNTSRSSVIVGGDGNDLFYGSFASDIIIGGPGNNAIYGRGGRDIIIGGTGSATIWGNAPGVFGPTTDGALIVDGATTLDDNQAALFQTFQQWFNHRPLTALTAADVIDNVGVSEKIYVRANLDRWFADSMKDIIFVTPPNPVGRSLTG